MDAEAERELMATVVAADVEAERIVEHLGIAVRRERRDPDELAAAELDLSDRRRARRPPLDERDGRDQPHRLFDGVGDERRVAPHHSKLVGMAQQEEDRVRHHRLHRLDGAEEDDAELRGDLFVG